MLDIIIVNYNSTEYLLRCLQSIQDSKNGVPFKIIVQDNGSEDSVDNIKPLFPDVVLCKNGSNLGFARAVNKGIHSGQSPYLMLINPDAYIEKNFLFDGFIEYMERNRDVGILGPKIYNPEGSIQGSARSFPSPLTGLFGRNTLLTKWFPNNPISRKNILTNSGNGNKCIDVDWVSGACMIIRREALNDVGCMDKRFFMYWEDADLCKRMKENGWRIIYSPIFSVTHQVGGSSSSRPFRSMVEFHKSSYKLFCKHNSPSIEMMAPFVAFALASKLGLVAMMNFISNTSKKPKPSKKRIKIFEDDSILKQSRRLKMDKQTKPFKPYASQRKKIQEYRSSEHNISA